MFLKRRKKMDFLIAVERFTLLEIENKLKENAIEYKVKTVNNSSIRASTRATAIGRDMNEKPYHKIFVDEEDVAMTHKVISACMHGHY